MKESNEPVMKEREKNLNWLMCRARIGWHKTHPLRQLLTQFNLFLLTNRIRLDTTYFVENWKHYNKINFKWINNTVEPIFNEKVVEKWNLWVSWIVHSTHLYCWNVHYILKKSQQLRLKKKRKKKKENTKHECAKRESKSHHSMCFD